MAKELGPLVVTLGRRLLDSLGQEGQADPGDQEVQADRTDQKETEKETLESPVRDQAVGRIVGLTEGPVVEDQVGHLARPEVPEAAAWRTKWTQ